MSGIEMAWAVAAGMLLAQTLLFSVKFFLTRWAVRHSWSGLIIGCLALSLIAIIILGMGTSLLEP